MNERRGTLDYRVAWEAKGEGGKGAGHGGMMIMSVWVLCSLCCAPDARSLRLVGHESTLLSSWCRVWHARRRGFGLLEACGAVGIGPTRPDDRIIMLRAILDCGTIEHRSTAYRV